MQTERQKRKQGQTCWVVFDSEAHACTGAKKLQHLYHIVVFRITAVHRKNLVANMQLPAPVSNRHGHNARDEHALRSVHLHKPAGPNEVNAKAVVVPDKLNLPDGVVEGVAEQAAASLWW